MRMLLAIAALIGALAGPVQADDMAQAGSVRVHDAWARASLGSAPNSAAYMTIETEGEASDRLVAISSPLVDKAELHTHVMEGGVAKMRPVDAIEVTPGSPTVLEPGGLHVMLFGLKQKLAEGDSVPLTLVFEHAGEVTVEAPVRAMAGMSGHTMDHAPKTN